MKIFDHITEKYKLTNSVIVKNEPKNTNVKSFKKPKKLKNLNILSLKIIETKQYIYIYVRVCVCVCVCTHVCVYVDIIVEIC